MSSENISIVLDTGDSVSKCGYTKTPDASHTHGMWAYHLTCPDYQLLCDRNWRRSGKYLYRPYPSKSKIIQYTIRLNTTEFVADEKHEKVLKKWNKYLANDKETVKESIIDPNKDYLLVVLNDAFSLILKSLSLNTEAMNECLKNQKDICQVLEHKNPNNGYYTNFVFRIFAIFKKFNLDVKMNDIAKIAMTCLPIESSLTNNMINFLLKDRKEKIKVLAKPPTPKKLTIKMIKSEFHQEEYQLYKKYQMSVHHDKEEKITEKGYTQFLVDSPLYCEKTGKEGNLLIEDEFSNLTGLKDSTLSLFAGYGSFHVQYRIDGQLMMVAVIDLLPSCLSSVYLFYDPDFNFLSPGVLSSLAEINYTRSLSNLLPDLKYYYLGYYIHDVQKMKYKGQYQPSELLCPTYLTYVKMNDVIDLVEKDCKTEPKDRVLKLTTGEIEKKGDVTCYLGGRIHPYSRIKTLISKDLQKNIEIYSQLVGPILSKRLAIVINE